MAGLFGSPKIPKPLPVINPADSQNRINDALVRQLASGGTNADNVAPGAGMGTASSAPRQAVLTGLN